MGWSQFVALQVEYSLLQRSPERELIPMARHFDMSLLPWAPLAGGALTGKYLKGDPGRIKPESKRLNENGLDDIDNRILSTIIDKFKGGPVGITTIATAVGEEPGTLEEVYEPFLIQEGFIQRTPRGREATEKAYRHLGRTPAAGGAGPKLF